jgi:hypothetical protein
MRCRLEWLAVTALFFCILFSTSAQPADTSLGPVVPSGPLKGRLLAQTLRIIGDAVELCVSLKNLRDRPFFITIDFRGQITTRFFDKNDRLVTRQSAFSYDPLIIPRNSWEDRNFFELQGDSRLETCRNYSLNDFSDDHMKIQTQFSSWLRKEDGLPPSIVKFSQSEDLPFTHDIVLSSNVCFVDKTKRAVACE